MVKRQSSAEDRDKEHQFEGLRRASEAVAKENKGNRRELGEPKHYLDPFSTSPTSEGLGFEFCINNAPLFAFHKHDRTYGVMQGCCNSWSCPRCGKQRAKQEYGRIVEGCRTLAKDNELWFITITCRGKEMSRGEADENYGYWTNKVLDAWRLQSKRTNQKWAYVQVTERQKRGHPHSHILTTFRPSDLTSGEVVKWVTDNLGKRRRTLVSAYRSDYIERSVVRAGLGKEYDISQAGQVEAVSRYVAKYMFKDSIFNTEWPKGWKRVRYSQSFPKLPDRVSTAFVLIEPDDWRRLAREAVIINAMGEYVADECAAHLRGSDVVILK